MRELKFRAWDTQMKIFSYAGWGSKTFAIFAKRTNCQRYIITQFTGLIDKEGVEIYEGDLMQIGGYRNYVGWLLNDDQDNGFWMFNKSNEPIHALDTGYQFYEIIGNIYENSELLDS